MERRLDSSRAWRARAERVIPSAAQTFSKSPMSFVQGVAPNFVVKARGAQVWDADGNCYLDYSMGLGPVILGHADPAVNDAAREQLEQGISLSLPHTIEVEVAELLCELIPSAEMVRFGKNGSDVTAAAVRLARAHTGRDKVARCGYHGWQDWYIGSTSRHLGVPEAVRRLTLDFPYNDLESLDSLFRSHPNQIACVIMEPVVFNPPQPGYLEEVRQLCRRHGALLIFDEIITGFRLSLGGAQEYYRVTPDLSCFGKAMANGFPLAAVVGRAEIMRLFNEVFFSGTFAGEAMSLAACRATIHELQARQGIAHLWAVGERLRDGTNALIEEAGLGAAVACPGLAPFTGLRFLQAGGVQPILLRSLFQQEALKRGILTLANHMLSLAHSEEIIDRTLIIYREIFDLLADAIRRGDVEARLEGPPIRPVFRLA